MAGTIRTDVRVIIGFAESFSAPEVAWSLVSCGFEVLSFARRGSRAALRVSRYATVFDLTPPEDDAQAAVRDLQAELELLGRDQNVKLILLPLDDASVWMCAQLPAGERLAVIGPGPAKVDFALDKNSQIAAARECGFRVPETLLTHAGDGVDFPKLRYPIIVKPARAISFSSGKLGRDRFHACVNETELHSALQTYAPGTPLLLQEYIAGTGEGLFGLAAQDGVCAWSAHRRIRMMNPHGSGASACVSITPNADDLAAGTRLISQVAWRGLFMVELLRDAAGKTWFVEFNGRVWGSTALARRCGLEYPAWAVLDAIGEGQAVPKKPSIHPGVICRHAGREAAHGLFVLRGARSRSAVKWPSRWKTLKELLMFRTSDHWYNWKREDWRVFVADFVVTLRGVIIKKRHKQQT